MANLASDCEIRKALAVVEYLNDHKLSNYLIKYTVVAHLTGSQRDKVRS